MYEMLLLMHSWMRWIVFLGMTYFLVVCVRAIVTKRAWAASDSHFIWAFNQAFLYQALFGFAIWLGASPFVRATIKEPANLFSMPFSFWTWIHPLTMISAIGVFHFGRTRANRGPSSSRFKTYAIVFTLILVMVGCAIPWPFLTYGRPLFRIP